MRALVVYESTFGNTHAVAVNIAAGLRAEVKGVRSPTTRPKAPLAWRRRPTG